jgi:phosphatidate cytidylyltransferase
VATAAAGRRDASLAVRVASAAVLAPAFLLAAWRGGAVFLAVVLVLALLAAREYARLALPGRAVAGLVVLASAAAFAPVRWLAPGDDAALGLLGTAVVLAALAAGVPAPDPATGARDAAFALLGAFWTGALFSFLVALRELPRELPGVPYAEGFSLLMIPVSITWTTDVAAYAAGHAWGGRRLLPRVSPGKTVAGALGGLAAAAAVGALLFEWAPGAVPRLGLAAGAAAGAGLAVLAEVGDLAKSVLKRAAGVKDSGRLIPGHGGVLDRFDALLFTAPVAYWMLRAVLA